ncbi:oxidoreductase [Kaistia algarum]|uniref:Gfo/Idh/MocA family protein n=1 Tax=Kaistia algarum TaxID=2083279 RepID=UPI000CE833B7|nr:Gfo/Idh/MocA family oxidoreductase [Kaistia algarum]MCX5513043.1 Gfo/Idh/MocA family oxidoreductase [Kaistia algarum]PPE81476.1 oxidoreductase [Kaistia algarum]
MTQRVGLIGCGNISEIYLSNAARFPAIRFVACADLNPEAAKAKAEKHGIAARSVADLLAGDDIDIVLNLTVPAAHAEVALAALANGKHVYTEKPLATTTAEGRLILETAKAKGLRVGAAPDTVLGAGVQTARRLIDEGAIGDIVMGTAAILSHGMEMWHPNPDFFFKPGAGPVLDMGPYYVATLITLLGPVATVAAIGRIGNAERIVTAPDSPFRGNTIRVETLTSVQALLQFASGAQVSFLASWDVWQHGQPPLELHGTEGSLRVPDPNWFGGDVLLARRDQPFAAVGTEAMVYGGLNYPTFAGEVANYRGLGLADMADAIETGRQHRANGEVGLHGLAVMEAMLRSATEGGATLAIDDPVERPEALGEVEAARLTGI